MHVATLTTFVVYFIFLLGVGIYFYRRSGDIEDYLLGGRGMGSWVTALSAQASDMSGWLLMGLPGAVFAAGLGEIWIAMGLLIGTALNWKLVAGRLRVYTEKTDAITLPCFFESRFGDPTGLLRTISAIIILIFFTTYASSCLVASGKLFDAMFENVSYREAVVIGAAVIILYTFLGGFRAVCWTDLVQGSLMFFAVLIVPLMAYGQAGGWAGISEAMDRKGIAVSLIPHGEGAAGLMILSAMAWGLGYFGQPHILVRFMSARSLRTLSASMTIALVWVVISLGGAVLIGLIGIGLYEQPPMGDKEKVLIAMIVDLFNPWIGGILLAAIFSAIMSTVDSQLLVSSSALTKDFYVKTIKRNASQREVMIVGRICVIVISAIALLLALDPESSVLAIVAYSWGGFGAAFGPLVLFALFSRRTTWQAALAGMVIGTVVLIVWNKSGMSRYLYELAPGFAANVLTILIVNSFTCPADPRIQEQYDSVIQSLK